MPWTQKERTTIAIEAMKSLIRNEANSSFPRTPEQLVQEAVAYADALMDELDKPR